MKFFKHLSTIILCLGLLLGSFTTVKVLAEEGEGGETEATYDVSGSKTASPVELDSNHRQTKVTLSLPSGEYQNEIDIVFTMDSSTSARNGEVFLDAVNNLFASILENNPNVKLKIGVIRFRGQAFDTLSKLSNGQYSGLVVYSDETKNLIADALALEEADMPQAEWGRGSNLHSGLVMAEQMLEGDEQLSDDHKYVIALTDCKTYIWNDDEGNPVCYYSQWYDGSKSPRNTINGEGNINVAQKASYNKYAYYADVLDPTNGSNVFAFQDHMPVQNNVENRYLNFVDLYNSTDPELTGDTGLEEPCYYAIDGSNPTGDYIRHETTNGAELFGPNGSVIKNGADLQYYFEFVPDEEYKGIKYYQANPFEVVRNEDGTVKYDENGKATFDTDTINPLYYQYHVDSLQKASYKSAHKWTDLKEKYNAAAIIYTGGSMDNALTNVRGGFMPWIMRDENSDYYADIRTAAQVNALFEGIDNSIRYMVNSGEVTDVIPEEFTLVVPEDKLPFTLELARKTYDEQGNETGEDVTEFNPTVLTEGSEWGFGAPVDDVYPYVVSYDKEKNSFVWTINVPVKNSEQIRLSYTLEIDKDAEPGYHETNEGAVLEFQPTTVIPGLKTTYEFETPKIIFNPLVDITVTKVWEDEDYVALKGYERPEEVTVRLLADNKADIPMGVEGTEWPYEYDKPADVKLNEDNELTYTFLNLNRYKIVASEDSDELVITEINYSAEEDEVAGFETGTGRVVFENKIAENAVKLTGSVEITNTPVDGEKVFNPIELTVKKLGKSVLNEEEIILKGAEFKLESEALKEPQTFTTDEDGTFKITFEVPGTYTLTETKAPVGYEIDGEGVYKIVVKEVGFVELVLNEETGVWDKVYDIAFDEETLKLLDKEGKELDVYNNQIVKELKISKTWNDNDNMFGCRPESVEVSILAGKETYDKVVLDEKGEWKTTVIVPVYDKDGKEVTYSVEEKLPAGYTVEYVSEKDVFEIINTFETTDITIIKTWEDNNNAEDARPEALIINVLAGEDTVAIVKLSEESQWQYTITMPKYDEKGNEVKYTVEEEVLEGYTAEYSVEGNVFTILNTRTPDTGDNSGVILYGSMLAFSGAMFIVLAIVLKKRYGYNR